MGRCEIVSQFSSVVVSPLSVDMLGSPFGPANI